MINSYYGILGITKISNKKEIISAFRRLARKYHPDVNSKNSYNEKKFKEINEAYQVLSDEKSRKDYDDFGEQWRYADQIRSNQINNNFKFNNFFNFNSSSRSNFEEKQVHKMEISVSLKELSDFLDEEGISYEVSKSALGGDIHDVICIRDFDCCLQLHIFKPLLIQSLGGQCTPLDIFRDLIFD